MYICCFLFIFTLNILFKAKVVLFEHYSHLEQSKLPVFSSEMVIGRKLLRAMLQWISNAFRKAVIEAKMEAKLVVADSSRRVLLDLKSFLTRHEKSSKKTWKRSEGLWGFHSHPYPRTTHHWNQVWARLDDHDTFLSSNTANKMQTYSTALAMGMAARAPTSV